MELLTHEQERLGSLGEVSEAMRKRYSGKVAARLDRFRLAGRAGCTAILTVYPTANVYRDGIMVHELSGEPAQLEWFQKDNLLVGFGFARTLVEATHQAMASAARGKLERRDLTVWWDRVARRFRFFDRGPGRLDASGHYRPRGRKLSRAGGLLAQ